MRVLSIISLMIIVQIFIACNKDDIDEIKPIIDLSHPGSFPVSCDTLKKGKEFEFRVRFTDNIELGSYNIDIHHNFDQHSHSTSVESCIFDQKKTAVKPWTFIRSYEIPTGNKEYIAIGKILVPDNIDPGDYHFLYKVTDKSGWQSIYGLSVKILE
jgi:hypothetical protein